MENTRLSPISQFERPCSELVSTCIMGVRSPDMREFLRPHSKVVWYTCGNILVTVRIWICLKPHLRDNLLTWHVCMPAVEFPQDCLRIGLKQTEYIIHSKKTSRLSLISISAATVSNADPEFQTILLVLGVFCPENRCFNETEHGEFAFDH